MISFSFGGTHRRGRGKEESIVEGGGDINARTHAR
jgi:hypothetical protein